MQWYLSQVKQLQSNFEVFSIKQVLRSRNPHANSLVTLATSLEEGLLRVIRVEDLVASSWYGQFPVRVNMIHVSPSWMDPVVSFLKDGTLPKNRIKAEKVQRKALQYWLSKQQKLYKQSYSGPYLQCVHPEVMEVLLDELHKGICGSHIRGRSLSYRAFTQGYLGPSMQKSAQDYVRKCNQC